MKDFWVAFIDDYESSLPYVPLNTILEAFYFYCKYNEDRCEAIMKGMGQTKGEGK